MNTTTTTTRTQPAAIQHPQPRTNTPAMNRTQSQPTTADMKPNATAASNKYPPCHSINFTESPTRIKGGRQTAVLSYSLNKFKTGEKRMRFSILGPVWPYNDPPSLLLIDAAVAEAQKISEHFGVDGDFAFVTPSGNMFLIPTNPNQRP